MAHDRTVILPAGLFVCVVLVCLCMYIIQDYGRVALMKDGTQVLLLAWSDVSHTHSDVYLAPFDVHHNTSNVHHGLSDVHHDFSDVHHDLSDVHHDLSDVHHDLSDVRHDLSDVHQRSLLQTNFTRRELVESGTAFNRLTFTEEMHKAIDGVRISTISDLI